MKYQKIRSILCLLSLSFGFFFIKGTHSQKVEAHTLSSPIVIDHTTTDLSKIPDYWLEQAKQLTLHYAHTSHGSQLMSGAAYLEAYVDTKYNINVRESSTEGLPSITNPISLRVYDGNPPETYIEPGDYWDGTAGLNRTRTVANTGNYNYSMWSWCGQQSSNSSTTVDSYLNNLNTLESEYPNMHFIYMTGHTDGSNTPTTPNTLKYNNQRVRDYVNNHNKVLFDFADIESYDPDGNYYPTTDDSCSWCTTWCSNHPTQCQNLPSCAHSHGFNCVQKGKAFWWMMARLAGWDGQTTNSGLLSVMRNGTGQGTVTSSPSGINCGVDCNELYSLNTEVTLTATPEASSTFSGWGGACTGTGNCTVTIDQFKNVTATFAIREDYPYRYFFTWNDTTQGRKAWTLITNPSTSETVNVTVRIGGEERGQYALSPGQIITPMYTNLQAGYVEVIASNNIRVITTQRVDYNGSFNEFAGIPITELTNHYYFTWNDTTQGRYAWNLVANPSSTQTAHVTIRIGGTTRGTYTLSPGQIVTPLYPNLQAGPVEVTSDINVIATQRVDYNGSFNEIPGIPANQLTNRYFYTWNDTTQGRSAWTLVANPSGSQTANVIIKYGNISRGYQVAPGQMITPQYYNLQAGPVEVTSDIDVYTTQRVDYNKSFNEFAGMAYNQLVNHYYFTWNDTTQNRKAWNLVGNASASAASVTIRVGGVVRGTYTLQPGQMITPSYANLQAGPVEISADQNIFTTQRVDYNGSFNEFAGIK